MTQKLINARRHTNAKPTVYHTDSTCQYLRGGHKPIEESLVEPEEVRECKFCAGTAERGGDRETECPFCNKTVGDLPDHLPCEESP